jgi:uncharacterized membrane protein YeaQ/YmgE (transglycosylase-associated protein family)
MQVTDYLSAILVGLVVGVLGRLVLPGRQRIGVFITFLIGVGAAVVGTIVARPVGLDDRAGVELLGIRWDWIVLAIQVGFAVIGIALANWVSNTRFAASTTGPRRRPARRRKARSRNDD